MHYTPNGIEEESFSEVGLLCTDSSPIHPRFIAAG